MAGSRLALRRHVILLVVHLQATRPLPTPPLPPTAATAFATPPPHEWFVIEEEEVEEQVCVCVCGGVPGRGVRAGVKGVVLIPFAVRRRWLGVEGRIEDR